MIVGILGKRNHGKDTFADVLVKKGFVKLSFSDPLKQICKILFNLSEAQLHDPILKETIIETWNLTPRQIFQKVGTDLFRNHFDEKIWLKLLLEKLKTFPNKNIVIPDIRFQDELDMILSLQNSEEVRIFEVIRPNLITTKDSHITENNNLHYKFTKKIYNDSSLENFQTFIENMF
jgi:hypothetical protein